MKTDSFTITYLPNGNVDVSIGGELPVVIAENVSKEEATFLILCIINSR